MVRPAQECKHHLFEVPLFPKDQLSGHVDNKYFRGPVEKLIQMQN